MTTEFDLITKNKNFFNLNSKNNGIILIEYNHYCSSHLCQALIANFLKQKTSNRIIAYYNYSIIVSPLKLKIITKIKWFLTNLLGLKFKGVYKSFGVESFVRPNISKEMSKKAQKITNKFFKTTKKKYEIINLKINKIWIGDLLYDTYLKSKVKPTIDANSNEFKIFFNEFIELFFYWENYLNSNKVTNIIGVHTCYSFGLLIRIGIYKNIPCFVTNTRDVIKLNKTIPTMYSDYVLSKKIINRLPLNIKKKGIQLAKNKIDERFSGKQVNDLFLSNVSSFKKLSSNKKILKKNSKIRFYYDFIQYFQKK